MLNGTERVLWRGNSQPGLHLPWGAVQFVAVVPPIAILGFWVLRDLARAHETQSLAIVVGVWVVTACVVAVALRIARAAPPRQYLLTTERVVIMPGRYGPADSLSLTRLGLVWRTWNVDETGSIWFELDGSTRLDASDSRRRVGWTASGFRDIADARQVFEMIEAAHKALPPH